MNHTRWILSKAKERVPRGKKWFILATTISLITISIIVFASNDDSSSHKQNIEQGSKTENKKVYKHTHPERISKTDYFPWEFISNDTASIYPRRDALVKDILVDIWDEVKAWDTLAVLFTPWVSWEWSSKIHIKNTLVSTKSNLLNDTINVKDAKVSEIDTKIIEKEIIISETTKNLDAQVFQLETLIVNKWKVEDNSVENALSQVKVEEKNLENLEINLENAKISKEQKLSDSENNKKQKEDLFLSKIDEIYHSIIPIFYIWNESDIDYDKVNKYDLADIFWAKNSSLKNKLIDKVRLFENNKDTLSSTEQYELLNKINDLLIETLKATIVSVTASESQISTYITNINGYNSDLLSSKENYDDAVNSYSILVASEDEKIKNLEASIERQKEMVNLKKSSYELVSSGKNETIDNLELELEKLNSSKSLQLEKLKAELETLKKSRTLLKAQEERSVTAIKNEIAVAKADLNSEYIKSGDYKITSPFSWVISKRWIDIWEKISLNTEAFRISGVETSLSRVTKKEIKFYVPENLKENLKLEKEIRFYLSDDKGKSFTGSIYRISPEIDEKTFSVTVQAKVADTISLPNKSTIRVSLENKEDVFKVPTTAVYNKNERKIIYYKKDNGKLGIKDVSIVSDDGEYSLVTGNFDESLKVVTTPIFIK